MFNPEQPRDSHGRWTKTKHHASFIAEHGNEIAIGLAIAGGVALTYGAVVAAGVPAAVAGLEPEAAAIIQNAATVRKIGPVALKGIEKLIPGLKSVGPKSIEAFQYSKGFLSPNLAEDTLEVIPGGVRQIRIGAEVATKTGIKSFGAAKPLLYDSIKFNHNPTLLKVGGGLTGAASVAAATTKLHKRKA